MPRKVHELRDLELTEISLVDKGANQGARVVLMKRDVSKMIKEENGKWCVYSEDGKTKLGEYDTKDEAMAAMKSETKKADYVQQFVSAQAVDGWIITDGTSAIAKATSAQDATEKIELAKAASTELMGQRGYKPKVESLGMLIRAGFEPRAACEIVGLPSIPHTGLVPITVKLEDEDVPLPESFLEKWMARIGKAGRKISAARMTKIKDMYKMLADMIAEQEGNNDEEDTMKTDLKTLPADVQAHIAELEKKATGTGTDEIKKMVETAVTDAVAKAKVEADKQIKEATDKAAAAEATAQVEKDARVLKEYEGKVSIFKRLPITEKDAQVFRAIDEKLPEDLAKRVWEIMKSADEALKAAQIMKQQIGSSEGDSASDDPVGKVMQKAEAFMEKDAKLSRNDAIAKVFRTEPALYAAYKEAVQVKV